MFVEPNANTPTGVLCTVKYNNCVKQHSQQWQALIYYRQLCDLYQHDVHSAEVLQLSQDSILDAASTSPTIQNGPFGDCN